MALQKLELKNADDTTFEVTLSPANRNVRLALNKIAKKEAEGNKKIMSDPIFQPFFELGLKSKNGEDTGNEFDLMKDGIQVIQAEYTEQSESLNDKYLIEKVKVIINLNTVTGTQSALIKSSHDSSFWSYQDLGELNECLNDFRKSFARRRP